ncbi:MAG: hypothetical protein R2911_27020 [Caldilineaceae bacterium]
MIEQIQKLRLSAAVILALILTPMISASTFARPVWAAPVAQGGSGQGGAADETAQPETTPTAESLSSLAGSTFRAALALYRRQFGRGADQI